MAVISGNEVKMPIIT